MAHLAVDECDVSVKVLDAQLGQDALLLQGDDQTRLRHLQHLWGHHGLHRKTISTLADM